MPRREPAMATLVLVAVSSCGPPGSRGPGTGVSLPVVGGGGGAGRMRSERVRAVVLTVPADTRASRPLIASSGTLIVRRRSLFGRTLSDTSSDLPAPPRNVTVPTPDSPEPTMRTVPPCRARP
jgi:hypothetical protein